MTLHRFFLPPETFLSGSPDLSIEGEVAHQLGRVLRMTPGSHILLLDGTGSEYLTELIELGRGGKHESVKVRLLEKRVAAGEPRTQIILFQGLLKGEKFDYVLQKGTEAGISGFVPVITERCVSDSASPAKLERWRKIVREAAEQSRRGILPAVSEPVNLASALTQMSEQTLGLIAWEDEHTQSLRQILQPLVQDPPTRVGWLIGPEGGLSQTEVEAAQSYNLETASLGSRIFRAETAGPIAAALTLYSFGDLEIN